MQRYPTTQPYSPAHPGVRSPGCVRMFPALRRAAKDLRCRGVYDTWELLRTVDGERGASGRLRCKTDAAWGLVYRFHIRYRTACNRVAELCRDGRFATVHPRPGA